MYRVLAAVLRSRVTAPSTPFLGAGVLGAGVLGAGVLGTGVLGTGLLRAGAFTALICTAALSPLVAAAENRNPESGRGGEGTFPSRAFVCGTTLGRGEIAEVQEKVQKAYGGLATFRASFVQESSSGALGVAEESTGTVDLQKPGRMRWHYTAPDEQIFLVRDKTVWFYQKRERQLVIDEFRQMLISELPVAFLMGIGNLARDFVVEKGCTTDKGITLALRENAAKSKGGEKHGESEEVSFTLLVDRQEFIPRGISLIDAGGNNTAIYFSHYEVNPTVGLPTFEPEFPKGVDVIDRRKERQ